jgi:amino acid permease
MIYNELEKRNKKTMSRILVNGSVAAVILYAIVGIFGYATFPYNEDDLSKANILEAPYGENIPIYIVTHTLYLLILGKFLIVLCYIDSSSTLCFTC